MPLKNLGGEKQRKEDIMSSLDGLGSRKKKKEGHDCVILDLCCVGGVLVLQCRGKAI